MRTLFLHFGMACLLMPVLLLALMPVAEAQLLAPPAKVTRYALSVIQRYDANGDGVLQRNEWEQMPGTPRAMDRNGDQQITLDELVWYFAHYGQGRTIHGTVLVDLSDPYRFDRDNRQMFNPLVQRAVTTTAPSTTEQGTEEDAMDELMRTHDQPMDDEAFQKLVEERLLPASRPYHVMPEHLRGVPAWFLLLDRNGDGQISLSEFAPTLAPARVRLFRQLDKDGNGLIEPHEVREVR